MSEQTRESIRMAVEAAKEEAAAVARDYLKAATRLDKLLTAIHELSRDCGFEQDALFDELAAIRQPLSRKAHARRGQLLEHLASKAQGEATAQVETAAAR